MKSVALKHGAIVFETPVLKKYRELGLYDYPVLHSEDDYIIVSNEVFEFLMSLDPNIKYVKPKRRTLNIDSFKELKTPREWQEKALRVFEKQKFEKGIIKMETGAGKTVFSLFLFNRYIKSPTIVVVDKHVLMEQWINSVNETLFGVKFAQLNRDNFEEVLKGEYDIAFTTVQFLLSLIKDNYLETFKKFFYSNFNAVIYDEAHTTAVANLYAKSLGLFLGFDYIFGLTATPRKSRFEDFLGDVIITPSSVGFKNSYKKNLYVETIETDFKVKIRRWPNIDWMTFLANYYTSAEKNENFMKFVVEKVKELVNQGRSVLLVVNRLSTANYIENEISEAKILTSKRKDEITESDNIVVATYNIASKGLDIPHIDTLVSLSLVRGNVSFVQLIGRILRQKEGKKNPLAMFIYDKAVKEHPDMYFIDEDIKNQIDRIHN